MKQYKKITLLCLIPVILTVFFIVQFTIPAVSGYISLNKEIKDKKASIKTLKASVDKLKANKAAEVELERIETELIGFDVEFPAEFNDEILLIDMEMFANEAVNRIVSLKSLPEKEIEITDPKDALKEAAGKKKKPAKRRGKQKDKELKPVTIIEQQFDINTVAKYNELINFVSFLENYQRKININSISAKIFQDDMESPNPRIDLSIKASTYKSVINEVKEEKEEEKNEQSKQTKL